MTDTATPVPPASPTASTGPAPLGVTNWPKLAVSALTVVCATVMLGLGRIGVSDWLLACGIPTSYVLGNGVAARRGQPVQPVIGPQSIERVRSEP